MGKTALYDFKLYSSPFSTRFTSRRTQRRRGNQCNRPGSDAFLNVTLQVVCAGLILLQGLARASDVNPIDVAVDSFRREHPEFPQPSRCSDGIFLRRVSLDLSGYPPTPEELAAFEADTAPDKDEQLIRRLLQSDRYSWKWGRWLTLQTGADEQELSYAAAEMHCRPQDLFLAWMQWARIRISRDESYEKIVESFLIATSREGRRQSALYSELDAVANADDLDIEFYGKRQTNDLFWRRYSAIYDPEFRAEDVANRFMGVNLTCARCHDHPTAPLTMNDHQQFTAIFEPVTYSELPLTPSEKRWILAGVAALPMGLCAVLFGLVWRYRESKILRNRTYRVIAVLVGCTLFVLLSYIHLIPGLRMSPGTSPGRFLATKCDSLGHWQWFLAATPLVMLFCMVRTRRHFAGRSSVLIDQPRWLLAAILLCTFADWVFVLQHSGDVQTRTGLVQSLQLNVMRWLGIGGCGQQPREIFVRSAAAQKSEVTPKLLHGPALDPLKDGDDPRLALMQWLQNPEVPYLAEHLVNTIWEEYFGAPLTFGIQENEEILTADRLFRRKLLKLLAEELRTHHWSIRHLQTVITTSSLYRADSRMASSTADSSPLPWLHAFPKRRLSAEQYLAAVEVATETSIDFGTNYAPTGASPFEVASCYPWSSTFGASTMRAFPQEGTLAAFTTEAAMFGLVDSGLKDQIRNPNSWVLRVCQDDPDIRSCIATAYSRFFCRNAQPEELDRLTALQPDRLTNDRFMQDIVWAMCNSAEFQYIH